MTRLRALVARGVMSEGAFQKLAAKNIHSAEDLLVFTCTSFSDVVSRTGLPEEELKMIVRGLSRELGSIPKCASEIFEEWKSNCANLCTGSQDLDRLLSGGFYTGEITELAGPCAAGKTQLCLSLAVRTCRSEKSSVAFFDSGTSFSIERIKEIAKAQHRAAAMRRRAQHSSYEQHAINPSMEDEEELEEDADADETWDAPLQRLQVYRVANAEALLWELAELEQQLEDVSTSSDRFIQTLKLIVVDSMGTLFSPLIGGASFFGHSLLVAVAQTFQRICTKFNISVVLTNHTTSRFNHLQQHQPALGDTWSHLTCVSISLSSPDEDMAQPRRRAQGSVCDEEAAAFYLGSFGTYMEEEQEGEQRKSNHKTVTEIITTVSTLSNIHRENGLDLGRI